ncbi:hypothetical protein LAWI1_G002774 [Lachnellula willkommii]|uniref:Uncharacterized protein n=1 Tax=Lachnellula willkommii TaxID=215461 RepID=A0A559MDQ3_9HELO|nr:hypothetical protein LAWI1_G002774 [Lachnellula willkommii]
MSVRIQFDNPHSFYTNLDFISGKIILSLTSDENVSAIIVKLEGESRTVLMRPNPQMNPQHYRRDNRQGVFFRARSREWYNDGADIYAEGWPTRIPFSIEDPDQQRLRRPSIATDGPRKWLWRAWFKWITSTTIQTCEEDITAISDWVSG